MSKSRSNLWLAFALAFFFGLSLTPRCLLLGDEPAISMTPQTLRTYSTVHSIGIEWDIAGDSNHNAVCKVQYRAQGTERWEEAFDLFRIDYAGWYGDQKADRPYNMLAGSILFLAPGASYEVRLALSDPDGGAADRTVSISTRAEPTQPKGGRTLHVAPGSGGGDGSQANPFQGLTVAQTAAKPGDIVLLRPGDYGSFVFDKPGAPGSYIVWKAADKGEAVFNHAVVSASHLWLEGLVFQRGAESANGLVAKGSPQDVVITRNRFNGFHYSITLARGSRGWHITDNTIVGDKANPDVSDISGEGVELNHSSDHVVAYNRISHTADGISYAERNCDLYGNDIRDLTDDGIEPDYGYANIRMWGNRIHNPFNNAFSFQPMYCGPWYFIRNEVFSRSQMLKPNVADRFVLVNNTMVVRGRYAQGRADLLFKSFSRNNLWILIHRWNEKEPTYAIWTASRGGRGGPYAMEYQPLPDWKTDVDYDGFDWDRTPTPFWWEVVPGKRQQFKDLESFSRAVGIEQHAIHVRKEEVFEVPDIPAYVAEPFSAKRLVLKKGCAAMDAGKALPNLCDDFEGAGPDLGAYELGRPLPHYGPRP